MLIGKEIEVLASRDKTMLKLRGLVVNETKNLLVVMTTEERQVNIPKSIVTLNISLKNSEKLIVEGSKLIGTPSDRIKG
jgi:ribonuclease P protein subunit POP4